MTDTSDKFNLAAAAFQRKTAQNMDYRRGVPFDLAAALQMRGVNCGTSSDNGGMC